MHCSEFLEDYSDFLDRRLEAHPLSEYRDHLRQCPECSRYDEVMQRGLRLVRELPPPTPGPDFLPRLRHRLYHVEGSGGRGPGFGRATTAGLLMFALVVAAAVPMLESRNSLQLPPVVVEAPETRAHSSTFFDAPTLTSGASFLVAPTWQTEPWLTPTLDQPTLFRAPLKTQRISQQREPQAAE